MARVKLRTERFSVWGSRNAVTADERETVTVRGRLATRSDERRVREAIQRTLLRSPPCIPVWLPGTE
jgi:hypothetical protein